MTIIATKALQNSARRTATCAVLGGVLQLAGVHGEWVFDPQKSDGTVTNPLVFSLLLIATIAGTGSLLAALFGLRVMHDAANVPLSRPGRIGLRLSIAANVLLLGFAGIVLGTALVSDAPAEASFVLFGLGMLLAVVGYAMLAGGLRRSGVVGGAWLAPAVAALGIICALVVPIDPWHDIGLYTSYAAWIWFGVLLGRHRTR